MQVTITLHDVSPATAKAIADLVAAHNALATTPVTKALPAPKATPAPTDDGSKAPNGQTIEPPFDTGTTAPKPAPKTKAAKAKPEPTGPTLDDVRVAARTFMEAQGPEALAAVIADFGAKKMSDVKPEQYPDLLARFAADAENAE